MNIYCHDGISLPTGPEMQKLKKSKHTRDLKSMTLRIPKDGILGLQVREEWTWLPVVGHQKVTYVSLHAGLRPAPHIPLHRLEVSPTPGPWEENQSVFGHRLLPGALTVFNLSSVL
jgi:hypothetical protein